MSADLLIFFIIIIIILSLILFYYIYETSLINYEYNTIKETECKDTRWGCCDDKLTPKYDDQGSNCRGF